MRDNTRVLATVLVIVVAALGTATLSTSLFDERNAGATSTVSEAPSAPPSASSPMSTTPSRSGDASSAPGFALIGQLVALPEVGCPGLHADGQFYLLLLPTGYEWTEERAVTYRGAVVARRGDTVAVIGTEAGRGICWATSFSRSLEVVNLTLHQAQPTPSQTSAVFEGTLTRYCDLGACCPALSISGARYALRLPDSYQWQPVSGRFELTDATGAVVAREGDVVTVEGDEAGPDTCWASSLEQSIRVASVMR